MKSAELIVDALETLAQTDVIHADHKRTLTKLLINLNEQLCCTEPLCEAGRMECRCARLITDALGS